MPVNNFQSDARCEKSISGTTIAGSQINGKYSSAIFGWSKAIFCIGDGNASKAVATIYASKPRAIRFHAISSGLFTDLLRKAIRKIIGAVTPDNISKLLPSNVIVLGTRPCWNNHSSTISTGILIT